MEGSVATWLSEQVDPAGTVLATDINIDFLADLKQANLEFRRHDILAEDHEYV